MNIVVVGDLLLDIDLVGSAVRLSPDAPVPVVDVADTRIRPGGAGLVAALLAADGEDVALVTALSDDERGHLLRTRLAGLRLMAGPANGPTPVKTRLRADGHPVARIDENCSSWSRPHITEQMLTAVRRADAIVVADYGRGVCSDPRLRLALRARAREVPLVWDPHPRGAVPVLGATAVTPNLAEAVGFAGGGGDHGAGAVGRAAEAARILGSRWQARGLVVTLGARGALLLEGAAGDEPAGMPLLVPTAAVDTTDPCGAGDRLAGTLAASLGRGVALPVALEEAVRAASRYLALGGTATLEAVTLEPGRSALATADGDALALARQVHGGGGTVVATGGCFDLLHAGHARTLAAARSLGDCLIVCLNSDASVRRLKGDGRPIIGLADRVALLLALECVDGVLVFDEDTPEAALASLRPDVWVKGGDYTADTLPEAPLVRSWGGCTVTVPYHPARSTSILAAALAKVS